MYFIHFTFGLLFSLNVVRYPQKSLRLTEMLYFILSIHSSYLCILPFQVSFQLNLLYSRWEKVNTKVWFYNTEHHFSSWGISMNWLRSCYNNTVKFYKYCKISNIRHTKFQNLNDSRFIMLLSLPNPFKLIVKLRMKMWLEQHRHDPTTSEWSTILLPTKVHLILEVWQYLSSITYVTCVNVRYGVF